MTLSDFKLTPCDKCGGKQAGFGMERTVYYLTEEIRVRCNNCGDMLVFEKRSIMVASAERTTRKQSVGLVTPRRRRTAAKGYRQ